MSFASLLAKMKGEKPASSLSDKNTQRRPQPSSKPQTSHTGTQSGRTTSTHINDGSRPTSTTSRRPLPPSSSQRVEVDPAVARLKQARKEENERRLEMMKAQGKKIPRSMIQAVEKPKVKTTPKITSLQQTRRQKTDPRNIPRNIKETQEESIYRQRGPRSRSTPRFQINHNNNSPSSSSSPTGPKLSFKDLIKQAEKIDTSKLLYDPIKKSPDPESKRRQNRKNGSNSNLNELSDDSNFAKPQHPRSITPSGPSNMSNSNASNRYDSNNKNLMTDGGRQRNSSIPRDHRNQSLEAHRPQPRKQEVVVRPAPIARPSESLLRKLKTKKQLEKSGGQRRPHASNRQHNGSSQFPKKKKDAYGIDADDDDDDDDDDLDDFIDYDDDDDGFIVDDEEDEYEQRRRRSIKEKGYDRDEIWSMFNNRGGHKRSYDYYDDDEDDMEATGSEILEEEELATRQARLDDIREQKLLEQRALEKQRRLKKSRY